MIPKIIHYCWFGGNPLSELALKCIESWKKFCPDYEIIRWDETNFDTNYCDYVREAYEAKKWAFVSDVVRLYVLVNYGGVYMDADVEVLKPLDPLLSYEGVSGFETKSRVPTGLMASVAGFQFFDEFLHEYDDIHFILPDGSIDYTSNVVRITRACQQNGLRLDGKLQTIRGFTMLPQEYLCPKDVMTGKLHITEHTYTIHHFSGSWSNEEQRFCYELRKKLCKFLPISISGHIAAFCSEWEFHGGKSAIRKTANWLFPKSDKDKTGGGQMLG